MPNMYVDIERVVIEDATARLQSSIKDFPDLIDRAKLIASRPGPALVGASSRAALLVVGCRGRSALAETLVGSVGSYCVKHAAVPVAVIIEDADSKPTIDRAVVGIDGSPNSAKALEWALRHVDPEGRIIAAGCWTDHVFGEPPLANPQLRQSTEKTVDDTVAAAVAAVGADATVGPAVETQVQRGDPRIVLRDLASTADLLVLGASGHRGVAYLLIGSTTSSLMHHPTSSTVVVPMVD